MTIDKKAVRQFMREVRDTLNKDWDPIGVYDLNDPAFENWPEDEYEGYAGKICALLQRNAPDEELLKYLEWAECDNIGVGRPFDRERAEKVIASLKQLALPPSSN